MLTTSARAVPDVHAALDADIGMRFIVDDFFRVVCWNAASRATAFSGEAEQLGAARVDSSQPLD